MKLLPQNITFIGELTCMPELRYTPQGNGVCILHLMSPDMVEVRAEAIGPMAEEMAEHWDVGQKVTILGSYKVRKYDTRDGEEREYNYFAITSYENG